MRRFFMLLSLCMVLYVGFARGEARRIGGHSDFIGVVSDTTGIVGDPGDRIIDKTTGKIYVYSPTGWYLSKSIISADSLTVILSYTSSATDTTKMTAPGYSAPVSTSGYQRVKWNFTVYTINTSVTIGLMERDTKSAWRYVESPIVYAANGNYGLVWPYADTADSLKLYWSAEAGGTAAIVTENVVLSGGGN